MRQVILALLLVFSLALIRPAFVWSRVAGVLASTAIVALGFAALRGSPFELIGLAVDHPISALAAASVLVGLIWLLGPEGRFWALPQVREAVAKVDALADRVGLTKIRDRRIAAWSAISLVALAVGLLLQKRIDHYAAAHERFDALLAQHGPSPGDIARRVMRDVSAGTRERRFTVPTSIVSAHRSGLEALGRQCLARLGPLDLLPGRLASARAEIDLFSSRPEARWLDGIEPAANRGGVAKLDQLLMDGQPELEAAAAAARAINDKRPSLVKEAHAAIEAAPFADLPDLPRRQVEAIVKALETAGAEAARPVALDILSRGGAAVEVAAREAALAASRDLLAQAGRACDALIQKIDGELAIERRRRDDEAREAENRRKEEERKAENRRAEELRQARADEERRKREAEEERRRQAAADERARIERLRAQLASMGYGLCEGYDVGGRFLRMERDPEMATVEECAAACSRMARCDGFRAANLGNRYRCTFTADTRRRLPVQNVISAIQGSCRP